MGLTDALKQIMTDGEHFVVSSGNTRKTTFVKLSKDNRTLILKRPGCFLTNTKKIKIADIKEIQDGHQANHWKTVKDKMLPKKKQCFSIIMEESKAKDKNLVGVGATVTNEWVTGLKQLVSTEENLTPEQRRLNWIWEKFNEVDKDKNKKLNKQEIFSLMNRLNLSEKNFSKKYAEKMLKKYDTSNDGYLSFTEVVNFFNEITERSEINDIFKEITSNKDQMSPQELHKFLKEVQGENVTFEQTKDIIRSFKEPQEPKLPLVMTSQSFAKLLLSLEWGNPYLVKHTSQIYQDMTQPLSHYFIASSHNTYLSDHQLYGESSIANYERAIDSGCRCVELDCWDGEDGEPIIYHGHTLTSAVKFADVIEAVNKSAFTNTDMPMLLSLENHCSTAQQDKMIKCMKEVFGDSLLLEPIDKNETELPSPQDLKNKVVLKGKLQSAKRPDMSKELSDSIIYMKSRHFGGFKDAKDNSTYEFISSIAELKALKLIEEEAVDFINHTKWQLVRIYPKGTRTDSSNYKPVPMWNVGSQIVALNYQNDDMKTYTNLVKFRQNKNCGFVLKPKYLLESSNFNPLTSNDKNCKEAEPTIYKIKIISGQQLPKPKNSKKDKDIIDPYIKLEIDGCKVDENKAETPVVKGNGFNPKFKDSEFTFKVCFPQLAFITFEVLDHDDISDDQIGFCTIPMSSLASGYRHIYLESYKGECLAPASFFVHIEVTKKY